jgi:cbb3-type cytochrome oxidase subunit 1
MPAPVRRFIKAGLFWLVLALVSGLWQGASTALRLYALPALGAVHVHLLVVGWLTQLVIGVAYWMFPKYSKEKPRGDERVGTVIFWTLNLGLLLRLIGEPLIAANPVIAGPTLLASALLQMGAGWLFVAAIWPRVKER